MTLFRWTLEKAFDEGAAIVLADGDEAVTVYENCNFHGLWVKEV